VHEEPAASLLRSRHSGRARDRRATYAAAKDKLAARPFDSPKARAAEKTKCADKLTG